MKPKYKVHDHLLVLLRPKVNDTHGEAIHKRRDRKIDANEIQKASAENEEKEIIPWAVCK